MQVTEVNDIKTYNLSQGKTIPEWLSDRKRRLLLKKDVDLRRRIQLIQDFNMPVVSNTVDVSRDGQYVIATGLYKPRVRCFDVQQLAMKFERCVDYEVIKCQILSEDYSKLLMLQEDRWVELHSQAGFYFRTRIPRFGRDLAYNYATCDAMFVGNGPEVIRLNLSVGTFLKPFETECRTLNAIALNPEHNLIVVGSQDGYVEAWDPRVRQRVGRLDCALESMRNDPGKHSRIPGITTLKYRDGLTMAAGTANGQILMYDLRSNRPFLNKDHMYGLPIKTLAFLDGPLDLVASLDAKIIKLWNCHTGAPFTAIQADNDLNDLAAYPDSGMLFVANESPKILTYYIPAIGPAPKWCSFLDRITEELEESNDNVIYDDYKFVTEHELEELGLGDLIGTNLLRAYMHGFFIDLRLYRKAVEVAQPFAYEEYKKQKIREKIDAQRTDRVQIHDPQTLPKVNRSLAEKLAAQEQQPQPVKGHQKYKPNPMKDERFAAMFQDPNFEIDETSEEFRLLNPVLTRKDQKTGNRMRNAEDEEEGERPLYADIFEEEEAPADDSDSELFTKDDNQDDDEEEDEEDDDSSDDELKLELPESGPSKRGPPPATAIKTKMFQMKMDDENLDHQINKGQTPTVVARQTLEQRLKMEESGNHGGGEKMRLIQGGIGGNRIMTFVPRKGGNRRTAAEGQTKNNPNEKNRSANRTDTNTINHLRQRKRLVRKTTGLKFNRKKNF